MNDQTRINTLLDTVTDLRAELAKTAADLAEMSRRQADCSRWWKEEEAKCREAERKLSDALAENNRLLLECAALTTRNTDLYNRCCQLEQERNEMREAAAPAIGGGA